MLCKSFVKVVKFFCTENITVDLITNYSDYHQLFFFTHFTFFSKIIYFFCGFFSWYFARLPFWYFSFSNINVASLGHYSLPVNQYTIYSLYSVLGSIDSFRNVCGQISLTWQTFCCIHYYFKIIKKIQNRLINSFLSNICFVHNAHKKVFFWHKSRAAGKIYFSTRL